MGNACKEGSNVPMYGKWVLMAEMGQESKEMKDILESRCEGTNQIKIIPFCLV